jgi:hypothetical protein|tara:strand:+ start:1574 stop:2215 length:642 start_codon:yes stop_codon:yes gene_type:complete
MTFCIFPTPFVYWKQIEEHETIRNKLLPKIQILKEHIKSNTPFGACKFKTSHGLGKINDFINDKFIQDELIWKPLGVMLEQVSQNNGIKLLKMEEFMMNGGWFNIYDKGEFQEVHDHRNYPVHHNGKKYYPCFSIVYILNNPGKSNDTVYKMNRLPFCPDLYEHILDTSEVESIKEGTVIITSSQMPHLVKPAKESGRVTLAYNIFAAYQEQK